MSRTISPDDMHSEEWQACLHIFCDMEIGYMALWGFGAKSGTGWMDGWSGVDTPQTVTTTRAPAVLKMKDGKVKKQDPHSFLKLFMTRSLRSSPLCP